PHGMVSTRPRLGAGGTPVAWSSTLEDLVRFVAGPAWVGLEAAGLLQGDAVAGRVGLPGMAESPGAWRYPDRGVAVAVQGEESAVLSAIDGLVVQAPAPR